MGFWKRTSTFLGKNPFQDKRGGFVGLGSESGTVQSVVQSGLEDEEVSLCGVLVLNKRNITSVVYHDIANMLIFINFFGWLTVERFHVAPS